MSRGEVGRYTGELGLRGPAEVWPCAVEPRSTVTTSRAPGGATGDVALLIFIDLCHVYAFRRINTTSVSRS